MKKPPPLTDTEAAKKLADPKIFIETFFWIVDKARKRVPFLFNKPQQLYYKAKTAFDLILKARKEGFSSEIEAEFLHACLFEMNTHAVTISHEKESTKRHLDRIKYFLHNMGTEKLRFDVQLETESELELTFPHTNSRYWIGTAGSKSFGRGDDITHLHVSEFAHYQHQEMITGLLEACVPDARRVFETTANGVGEMFYQLWKEAEDPQADSAWKPHFFAWFDDPTNVLALPEDEAFKLTGEERTMKARHKLTDRQIYWYRRKKASLADKALMPQEYPSTAHEAFISSGRHAFNLQNLTEMLEASKQIPFERGDLLDDGAKIRFNASTEGTLTIWRRPQRGRSYLIPADVAKGVQGGDFSVGDVYDRNTHEQVAQLRLRIDPGTWGEMLQVLARFYNNALIQPESNNDGKATIERLQAIKYPHLVKCRDLWGEDHPNADDIGFPTNEKTRALALTSLRNSVEDRTVPFRSPVTLNEMMTFVQNKNTGKFEAQEGCFDDCVMTAAIGVYTLGFVTVEETYAPNAKGAFGRSAFLERHAGAKPKMPGHRRAA